MAEADLKVTIDQVAELMEEFRLAEARFRRGDLAVSFRRRSTPPPAETPESEPEADWHSATVLGATAPPAPRGTPVVSPMNGIYYGSPNPGSPPFVRPGDSVSAGQIIGLIEAMKVFNEIPCTVAGTVVEVVAQTAQIVNPGDVLLYVEPEG